MIESVDKTTAQLANPWSERDEIGKVKAVFMTAARIILKPKVFFRSIVDEHPAQEAVSFYVFFFLMELVIIIPLFLLANGAVRDQLLALFPMMMTGKSILAILLLFLLLLIMVIFMVIGLFVMSLIVHIFALILRGKGGLSGTMSVLAYNSASQLLFLPLWTGMAYLNIPAFGALFAALGSGYSLVAFIWSSVITVIGYKEVHRMGVVRAIALLVAPVTFFILLQVLTLGPGLIKFAREGMQAPRAALTSPGRQKIVVPVAAQRGEASSIVWGYDLKGALAEAAAKNAYVMADFYTDWCGWCKKLDSDTYSDGTVAALARTFVCVKVDGDRNSDLVSQYGVRGYPTIIIFAPNGKEAKRIPGYVDARTFAAILMPFVAKTPAALVKAPAAPVAGYMKKEMDKIAQSTLKFGGIAVGPNGYRALIGDKIVGVGGKVERYTVTAISKNSVTLKDENGKEITLR